MRCFALYRKLAFRPITPRRLFKLKTSILFFSLSKTNGTFIKLNLLEISAFNTVAGILFERLSSFHFSDTVFPTSLVVPFIDIHSSTWRSNVYFTEGSVLFLSYIMSHWEIPFNVICWWLLIQQKLLPEFQTKNHNCLQDMCIFLPYFKLNVFKSEFKIFINSKIYSSSSVLHLNKWCHHPPGCPSQQPGEFLDSAFSLPAPCRTRYQLPLFFLPE